MNAFECNLRDTDLCTSFVKTVGIGKIEHEHNRLAYDEGVGSCCRLRRQYEHIVRVHVDYIELCADILRR